jgi:hypothetical protein
MPRRSQPLRRYTVMRRSLRRRSPGNGPQPITRRSASRRSAPLRRSRTTRRRVMRRSGLSCSLDGSDEPSFQTMGKRSLHRGQRIAVTWRSGRLARWRQLGHTRYGPDARSGRATVHSRGGVLRSSSRERSTGMLRPRTQSCTSRGVSAMTGYQAPHRSPTACGRLQAGPLSGRHLTWVRRNDRALSPRPAPMLQFVIP